MVLSEDYSLTEALGVFFIIISPVPLVFSFIHIFVSLPSILFYLEFPQNYYQVFLLYSFFIMIPLGWCLADKEKWAKEAAILFMIVSIIMGLSSILLFGIDGTSTWIESLIWTIVNFFFLGILLFDFPWNSPSVDESGTLSNSQSSIVIVVPI